MFRSSFETLENIVVIELSPVEAWEVSETSVRHNDKDTMRSGTGTCKLPFNKMFRSSFETLENAVVIMISSK